MKMTANRIAVFVLASAHVTSGCAAHGQIPFDHRPSADTITSAIVAQGAVGPWADHVDFAGCPQHDPLSGSLLRDLALPSVTDRAMWQLAFLRRDELATCGSSDLESWYRGAIAHAGG